MGLSFMGGMDIRVLNTNDTDAIDRELSSKIPTVMSNNGYVLHTDHSIPQQVDYDSYKYFVERGLELGTYH
jgi:uroporphyrinogen decarboxylase